MENNITQVAVIDTDILKQIDWECELCGYKEHLVNHHISYVPERIIVVCPSCHTKIHKLDANILLQPERTKKEFLILQRVLCDARLPNEFLDKYRTPEYLKKIGRPLASTEEMRQKAQESPII